MSTSFLCPFLDTLYFCFSETHLRNTPLIFGRDDLFNTVLVERHIFYKFTYIIAVQSNEHIISVEFILICGVRLNQIVHTPTYCSCSFLWNAGHSFVPRICKFFAQCISSNDGNYQGFDSANTLCFAYVFHLPFLNFIISCSH